MNLEDYFVFQIGERLRQKYVGLVSVEILKIFDKHMEEDNITIFEVVYEACFKIVGSYSCYKGIAVFISKNYSRPLLDYVSFNDEVV